MRKIWLYAGTSEDVEVLETHTFYVIVASNNPSTADNQQERLLRKYGTKQY